MNPAQPSIQCVPCQSTLEFSAGSLFYICFALVYFRNLNGSFVFGLVFLRLLQIYSSIDEALMHNILRGCSASAVDLVNVNMCVYLLFLVVSR